MLIFLIPILFGQIFSEFDVNKVERSIDLSDSLTRIKTTLDISCSGQCGKYMFALPLHHHNKIAYIDFKVKNGDQLTKVNFHKNEKLMNDKSLVIYELDLQNQKLPLTLVSKTVSWVTEPYPKELKQGEKQFLLYTDNMYLDTSYPVKSQTTIVKFPITTKIESYTEAKDKSLSQLGFIADKVPGMKGTQRYRSLTYGPFEASTPFMQSPFTVHYLHDVPRPVIHLLERDIEISHWGQIDVTEKIYMQNMAGTLKPPFSRFKFQQPGAESGVALIYFQTILPAHSRNIYYRDEIGNISTSNVLPHIDGSPVEVIIKPRFPMFGGWNTTYTIGYSLPTYPYLKHKGSNYELKIRFVDHIYHDQLIDKAIVRVIFPEGSKIKDVKIPFEVSKHSSEHEHAHKGDKALERHYTYLDTVGRPVLQLTKHNLVDEHIKDFTVYYDYQKVFMLQEPLLLVSAYLLLFLVVMFYVRMDFSISKDDYSESKLRISGQLSKVKDLLEQRECVYENFVEAINKYKVDKDVNQFNSERKKIEGDLKRISQKIGELQYALKPDSHDSFDKLDEIQRLDKNLKEQVMGVWIGNVEKVINGKMTRQIYVDAEKISTSKKDELLEKMRSLL